MWQRRVVVAGSANLDLIYYLDVTRPTDDLSYAPSHSAELPGGHGGNCAVAARRFGAPTSLLSVVGDDAEGRILLAGFANEGVAFDMVEVVSYARTGRVFIPVFAGGYKFMVFDADIRRHLGSSALPPVHPSLMRSVVVIMDVIPSLRVRLLRWAVDLNAQTVLGLCASAPFTLKDIPADLWPDYVIANEAEMTLCQSDARPPSGKTRYVTTLGRDGCRVTFGNTVEHHEGWPTVTVDAVGAGDCFAGIFAACLVAEMSLGDALARANAGAAMSTRKFGAQTGYPSAEEVSEFIRSADV